MQSSWTEFVPCFNGVEVPIIGPTVPALTSAINREPDSSLQVKNSGFEKDFNVSVKKLLVDSNIFSL